MKDATTPYKFFAIRSVGLEVEKAEKGVRCVAIDPNSPFGIAGLAVNDTILSLDDAPSTSPERFRTQVRRAMIAHGNCLLTVSRDGKARELVIRFPDPK